MNQNWLVLALFMLVLIIILGIVRYRLYIGRLALKEEEQLLDRLLELLQKEQKEMDAFKAQLTEEIHLWKTSRQEGSERIEAFQNELLSDMESEEEHCYWQDTLLNLTFFHKLEECRNHDIAVTLKGFPQDGMPAPKGGHVELTSLMINLFDNAREACQLIPKEEDRWIIFEVRKNRGRVYLSLKNSCNERSAKRPGTGTWKKNAEEHGIGLDIINDLVSDMKGWVRSERKNNVYHVTLMLPVGRGR